MKMGSLKYVVLSVLVAVLPFTALAQVAKLGCKPVSHSTRMKRLLEPDTLVSMLFKDGKGESATLLFLNDGNAPRSIVRKWAFSDPPRSGNPRFSEVEAEKLAADTISTFRNIANLKVSRVGSKGCLLGGLIVGGKQTQNQGGKVGPASALNDLQAINENSSGGIDISFAKARELNCDKIAAMLECDVIATLGDYSGKLHIRDGESDRN